MGIKIRPLSPDLERALGFHYLLQFFGGKHIATIARETHSSRRKVRKVMKAAAAALVDAAQHTLLAEVFPKMVQVLNAHFDQQLARAKDGKPVDTSVVERLLKGLYITDAPQLRTQLMKEIDGGLDTEVQTLEGFVARRVLPSATAGSEQAAANTPQRTDLENAQSFSDWYSFTEARCAYRVLQILVATKSEFWGFRSRIPRRFPMIDLTPD